MFSNKHVQKTIEKGQEKTEAAESIFLAEIWELMQ
jgi:hypothetical protein